MQCRSRICAQPNDAARIAGDLGLMKHNVQTAKTHWQRIDTKI